MSAPAIVELHNVTKRFFGVTAVRDLSLALHPGKVFCLLGENGAGKSTIIKILTGVERPTLGEVLVDGKPIRPDATYRVVVNNFLASGGDGFTRFNDGRNAFDAGLDLEAAMRRAAIAASLACLKPGAQPAIPTLAEVEAALA